MRHHERRTARFASSATLAVRMEATAERYDFLETSWRRKIRTELSSGRHCLPARSGRAQSRRLDNVNIARRICERRFTTAKARSCAGRPCVPGRFSHSRLSRHVNEADGSAIGPDGISLEPDWERGQHSMSRTRGCIMHLARLGRATVVQIVPYRPIGICRAMEICSRSWTDDGLGDARVF